MNYQGIANIGSEVSGRGQVISYAFTKVASKKKGVKECVNVYKVKEVFQTTGDSGHAHKQRVGHGIIGVF